MEKKILITTSLGLCTDGTKYYLQIIIADNGNHYFQEINQEFAESIAEAEDLEIENITEDEFLTEWLKKP